MGSRAGNSETTVKHFAENLLPEGHAFKVAAGAIGASHANTFGRDPRHGAETTGASRFLPAGIDGEAQTAAPAHLSAMRNWKGASQGAGTSRSVSGILEP